MRALVLEEIGRLAVRELPEPEPGPDEVLIEVAVTGICGSDIHGFTGENGRRVPGQVMGHESAGRVVALGSAIPTDPGSGLRLGRTVTFNPVVLPAEDLEEFAGREQHDPRKRVIGVAPELVSAFAERIVVPARNVVPLPDGLSVAHGALVEPLAVALHAVRRGAIRPGDRVLVAGGGPIGQSVVLALAIEGVADVLVSEVSEARRDLVERLGVTAVDPSAVAVAEAVRAHFGTEADAAVDAVGIDATLAGCLAATAQGARIVLVGMGSPRLGLDAYAVSTEERTIIGSFTYSAQDFADAVAGAAALADERLDALVSRTVALDEAPDAFAALAAGDGTAGKVLVRVSD